MKTEKYYFGYTCNLKRYNDTLLIIGVDEKLVKAYLECIRGLDKDHYYIEKLEYDSRRDDFQEVNDNIDLLASIHYSYYLPDIDIKRLKEDFDQFMYKLEDINIFNKELLLIISKNYKKGDRIGLSRSIFDHIKLMDEFVDIEQMRNRLEKAYICNHSIFTDSIYVYIERLRMYREDQQMIRRHLY